MCHFRHRALISPVIRFVTTKPHHATVPAWCHAKQKAGHSQPKLILCSHYGMSFLPFSPPLVCFSALTPSVWPFCRSLFLPSSSDFLFLLFQNFFFIYFFLRIPDTPQDNVIDRGERFWNTATGEGSQCNPFYSNQNSLHRIRQEALFSYPFVIFWEITTIGERKKRKKKRNRGGRKKKISIHTKLV